MLQEGRTYTIITQSPQLALGILELDSPLIVGLEPNRSNNQKWIATREESGGWTLKNVANGKYLGVDGEPRVLARLIGVDSSTLWRIEREGEGTDSYWILAKDSELTVGILPMPIFPPFVGLEGGMRQAWKFAEAEPL